MPLRALLFCSAHFVQKDFTLKQKSPFLHFFGMSRGWEGLSGGPSCLGKGSLCDHCFLLPFQTASCSLSYCSSPIAESDVNRFVVEKSFMAQFNFSCAFPLFPALFFFGRGKDLHDAVCQGGRGLLTMLTVLSCSSMSIDPKSWVIIPCICGVGVSSICGLQVILSGSGALREILPTPHRCSAPQGQGVVLRKLFHYGNHVFHQSPHKHALSPYHHLWHSKAQMLDTFPCVHCNLSRLKGQFGK